MNEVLPDQEIRDRVLRRMTKVQAHRGPDDEGIWHDAAGRCSLGHRRLSIIDTSDAGHQPMVDPCGRWVITFNGEIYNYRELRGELEGQGVQFSGRTDTEVLLRAIAFWGADAVVRLDGMFAFAAFDRQSGQVILARDAFGEKPLYYAELPRQGLAFASELQALEEVPGVDCEVSADAMAELLMFQYIGAPRSIYAQVKKLPPGHWLIAYPGQPAKIGQYFTFRPGVSGFDERPLEELTDELEDILVRSLRRRLIADVPLGAFLSGGVDSSTVCALIRRRLNLPLNTYSVGFADAPESEHRTAQQFAVHLGTDHHEKIVVPQASDFLRGIGRVLDEPNGDSSCLPTYLLSAFARESVTVAVSGDGGDEMFGGYGRYFQTVDEGTRNGALRKGWDAGKAYYSNRILVSTEEHLVELFGHVPSAVAAHVQLLRETIRSSPTPLLCRLRQTDVGNYLPGAVLSKVDRMSMQHSLEVRTPFLSVELARFAERLYPSAMYANKKGKRILRELAYRYLPRDLIDLPKQGFGLPMTRWGRDELLGVAGRLLESDDSRLRQCLGSAAVTRFMTRQRSPNGFATYQVWALAMLESWLRHHPAKLPSNYTPSFSAGTHLDEDWRGIPIDSGIVAAVKGGSSTVYAEPLADLEEKIQQAILDAGLFEFASDQVRSGASNTGKSIPLAADVVTSEVARHELRGATLLIVDRDNVQHLDADLLYAWRAAGVERVILPHPHRGDGTYLRLRFNRLTGWPMVLAWLRLRRSAKAFWWGFLARRTDRDGLLQVGPLAHLNGPQDSELSHRYLLFRGLRQLPPLPTSHAAIAELQVERYSVWSRHCLFRSPSKMASFFQHYWLVEDSEAIRRLLPMAVDIIEAEWASYNFLTTLQHKIADDSGAVPPALQPGDPIVVFTHSLQPGGAERQWCYLAIALKQRGFNVSFVVQDSLEGDKAHYRPLLEPHGIEPIDINRYSIGKALALVPRDSLSRRLLEPRSTPFGIRLLKLTACFAELSPKAVFAQLDTVNLKAGIASVIAKVPRCVLSFRNFNPTNFPYIYNDWFLPCYQELLKSPRIVLSGNSEAANADYAAWLGVPETRVAFVPNAIDVDDLGKHSLADLAYLRAELALEDDIPVILGVFRLSEEKDPLTFLRVCATVAVTVPRLRILIAGVGRLQTQMEVEIQSLKLEGKVALLGRRSDVPALMSIASVLLLTSTHEGMPNVVMEAQALGLPVVATDTGGTPDIVVDGVTGLVRAVGDVPGLVEACTSILVDSALRARMQVESRSRISERFSTRAMVDRYIAAAASAIDPSQPTSSNDSPHVGEGGIINTVYQAP